jgi:hypothetical protein
MRQYAPFGAIVVLLFGGAVVLAAASPAPSPSSAANASGSPAATATPRPSASPTAKPAPSASTAPAEPSFTSTVKPLEITGTATVVESSADTGTVTLKVSGLLDAQRWSVDIDGGTVARPNEAVEIAFKSGADITRLASDTIRVHLTKTEMARFMRAEKSGGVVAEISDGVRIGYAEFQAG